MGFIALLVARTLLLRKFGDEDDARRGRRRSTTPTWAGSPTGCCSAASSRSRSRPRRRRATREPLDRPKQRARLVRPRAGLDLGARRSRAGGGDRRDRGLPRADPGAADRRRAGWRCRDLLRRRRADRLDRAGGGRRRKRGAKGKQPRQPRAGGPRRWRRATIVAVAVGRRVLDHRRGQGHEVDAPGGAGQELQRLRAAVRPDARRRRLPRRAQRDVGRRAARLVRAEPAARDPAPARRGRACLPDRHPLRDQALERAGADRPRAARTRARSPSRSPSSSAPRARKQFQQPAGPVREARRARASAASTSATSSASSARPS